MRNDSLRRQNHLILHQIPQIYVFFVRLEWAGLRG
jgi:hypothetical protein